MVLKFLFFHGALLLRFQNCSVECQLVRMYAKQPASRITHNDSRRDEEEENDQTEQQVQSVHAVVGMVVQQVTFGWCEDRGKEGESHCHLK